MSEPAEPVVVIDTGAAYVKIGTADDTTGPRVCVPTVCVPTVFARDDEDEDVQGIIGDEALMAYEERDLGRPLQGGIVRSWPELEYIYQRSLSHEIGVSSEDGTFLMTEPSNLASLTRLEFREGLMQLMFETFSVGSMHIAPQQQLSLFAAARTSGLVMESGESHTNVVALHEGQIIMESFIPYEFAGEHLTSFMSDVLRQYGFTSKDLRVPVEFKEQVCFVDRERQSKSNSPVSIFTLPDGREINAGENSSICPERMFSSKSGGLQNAVKMAIEKCDTILQRTLSRNIIISGGNTMLRGFRSRLQRELDNMLFYCGTITAPADRNHTAWIGGAILASMPSFQSLWTTKEEYDEHGAHLVAAVQRKF